MVWIDAQGHDGHILASAGSLLQSTVPVVVEYCPHGLRRSSSLALLHATMAEHYSTVVGLGGRHPDRAPGRRRPLA